MTSTDTPMRNGVDTATLFATLDAVKGEPGDRQVPVPGEQPLDQRHPQPVDDPRLLRRGPGARRTAAPPRSTPTTRRCSSAQDNAPTPVEYLLHALAACLTSGHRQHRRGPGREPDLGRVHGRGRHRPARHPRACPTRSATATSRSGSASTSRATTPTSCAASWSSRGCGRRCTTCSPTACPSASRSPRADRRERTSTSWSSGHGAPAPRRPCCWRGPASGSRWSTAAGTAATRCRPTG